MSKLDEMLGYFEIQKVTKVKQVFDGTMLEHNVLPSPAEVGVLLNIS